MAGCARCGDDLPPLRSRGRARKWCSETCRVRAYEERNPKPAPPPVSRVWFRDCAECGHRFCARSGRTKLCGPECTAARHRRRYRDYYAENRDAESRRHQAIRANATPDQRAKNYVRRLKRRAAECAAAAEVFDPREIFDRDGWVCQLCLEPIDPSLKHPDRWSASLDHKIPLSLGGPHTRANRQSSSPDLQLVTRQPDERDTPARHGHTPVPTREVETMAGRGFAPKDPSKRAGHSPKDPIPLRVITASRVEQPKLPGNLYLFNPVTEKNERFTWPAQTKAWWKMWAESPLSADFTSTDWSELLDTAFIHARFWRGDVKVAPELRLRVAKFGATPEDRARLRITFADADEKDERRGSRGTTGSARQRYGGRTSRAVASD